MLMLHHINDKEGGAPHKMLETGPPVTLLRYCLIIVLIPPSLLTIFLFLSSFLYFNIIVVFLHLFSPAVLLSPLLLPTLILFFLLFLVSSSLPCSFTSSSCSLSSTHSSFTSSTLPPSYHATSFFLQGIFRTS